MRRPCVVLALLLFACDSDPKPSPAPGPQPQGDPQQPPSPSSRSLSGTATYDKVPATATGLNFPAAVKTPIRGANVELLDGENVVATTRTSASGQYALAWPASGPTRVRVRVRAETTVPPVRVEDNTSADALYAMVSPEIDAGASSALSLNASSGWGGSSYTSARVAAPFAVLDAAYAAAQAFAAERAVTFPPLRINWSPDNRPEPGERARGQIGTSHWDGEELYVLGKEDVDTDEFDSMIVVHEWGHYFESKLSRSDSPGGDHVSGQHKDPRLAWGEGWATGFAGIVLHPDTHYADTMDRRQGSTGVSYDLEDNAARDPNPGWYSEFSVVHLFYDLWDGGSAESFDRVSLPLGALYDAMVGGQKRTPAFTTIFSFVDALKTANRSQAATIDALLARAGIAPVQDAYGAGETNDAGSGIVLPVHHRLTIGGAATPLGFISEAGPFVMNSLRSNRLATFDGDGRNVTIRLRSDKLVGMRLYEDGSLVATTDNGGTGEAALSGSARNGAHYGVVAIGGDTSAPRIEYAATLRVTSP